MNRYDRHKKADASSSAKEAHPPGSLAEKKAHVQQGMKQWWQQTGLDRGARPRRTRLSEHLLAK